MEQFKPSVLVADDSRVVRKAASGILSANYRISEAVNGTEALKAIAENAELGAVFLDLWMPDIDGFEVLKQLRASSESRLKELPVIIITGDGDDERIREKALALGASDFISKPFSGAQLKDSLESLVDHSPVPSEVPVAAENSSTQEIAGQPAMVHRRLLRRDQLLHDGGILLDRCLRHKHGMSVMKIRLERVGALYHKTGEAMARETLRLIGQTISLETRRKDLLVRMNVTDFVVVMPSTGVQEAKEVALRIYRAVRHHVIEFEGARYHLTMSGSLISPRIQPQLRFESILDIADSRLQRAVDEGGNRLVSADTDPADKAGSGMSLDEAASSLKMGETELVDAHIGGLLKKAFPLLVFANARMKLDIDAALKKLHACISDK